MGDGHPECPRRLSAIEDALISRGIFDFVKHIDAPKIDRHSLRLAHKAHYIDTLISQIPGTGYHNIDHDTRLCPDSLEAAYYSAGAGIRAVDGIMAGEFDNAFCAVRPPGHHAEKITSMGFCFFNNAAITALYAIKRYKLRRVVVIDFDAHHGNGTENILGGRFFVRYWSSYQKGLFPFRDENKKPKRNISLHPLNAGAGSDEFRALVGINLIPWLNRYKPQLIILSSGFDAHKDDYMSQLNLTDEDFRWVIEKINDTAKRVCDGRIVSILEGGYNLPALGRCCADQVKILADL